jgi:thiol-disulfide isomerase/thioredoxin
MRFLRLMPNGVLGILLLSSAQPAMAARTTVADALKLTPIQNDVAYDRPSDTEAPNCKLTAEKTTSANGWVVRGPAGQLLRRFLDTNGDNKVDQWCYYHNGVEVYRDIDANFNEKADQYRWLGTAGMRWGLDENEDGVIDTWKSISAEEVTAELVASLRDRDAQRFRRLLLSASELKTLGLSEAKQNELLQKIQAAPARFTQLARTQQLIGPKSEWIQFGGSRPGRVPAGAEGFGRDLVVYENVMAMFETEDKPGQLSVGSLVQIEDTWRLIDVPVMPSQGQASVAAGGYFFAPADVTAEQVEAPAPEEADPRMQQLVATVEKLEAEIAGAGASQDPKTLSALNRRLADALEELAQQAKTPEEQSVWTRQLADTISAAVQAGTYPEGVEKLASLAARVEPQSEVAGYVKFRQMTAAYTLSLQDPNADFAKIQEEWLKQLEEFVQQYPSTSDAPEAMLQLAIAEEFAGNDENARKWYQGIVQAGGDTLLPRKAQGALRRLESVGKPLRISGRLTDNRDFDTSSARGRLVLVHYWATWCEPCKQDLELLRDLHTRYGSRGFQLVGVNLDNDTKVVSSYLRQSRLEWPQIHDAGGLDGRLAVELGILTLPTMILIDQEGNVLNRNIHVSELEDELRKRMR